MKRCKLLAQGWSPSEKEATALMDGGHWLRKPWLLELVSITEKEGTPLIDGGHWLGKPWLLESWSPSQTEGILLMVV